MNKEKLMQFISDAIDQGANINISFYSSIETTTDAQAKKKADNFCKIIGTEDEPKLNVRNGFYWYRVSGERFELSNFFNHFEQAYMEEDVKLDGMPEKEDDKIA